MKKGFTIIEIVIVLGIISIISSISYISYKSYKSYINTVDSKYYCNSIVNFINYSKSYCRENKCGSIVVFDIEKNQIELEGKDNILTFPSNIKLKEFISRGSKQKIYINKHGVSNDAFTLRLEDGNGEEHIITMRVGTSYVKNKK